MDCCNAPIKAGTVQNRKPTYHRDHIMRPAVHHVTRNIALAAFAATLIGCGDSPPTVKESASGTTVFLEQGWGADERQGFYYTSQGSQLLPYSWFLALEQVDNEELFRSDRNMRRYGYIPQPVSSGGNPDGLPIGFVKDDRVDDFVVTDMSATRLSLSNQHLYHQYQEWLGFTCAACHTSEVEYAGRTLRIDGGPPLADFQSMLEDLSLALATTIADEEKLERFSRNVLAVGSHNEGEVQRLKNEISAYLGWFNRYAEFNYRGAPSRYGHGRLDAFGAILNRVTASFTGIPENAAPANAPVSFPMLWNVSHLDWVQWNGSANNHIARNVGEVAGVFAHATVETPYSSERFTSSANIVNLDQLERLISALDSPKWGPPLPAIDEGKAQSGKELFDRHCAACHGTRDANGEFPMTEPNVLGKRFIKTQMIPLAAIGTDPLMATNFVNPEYNVDPGPIRPLLPAPYQSAERVPRPVVLSVTVRALIKRALADIHPPLDEQQLLALAGDHLPPESGGPTPPNLLAYKARPLNGIWATAPFLHNGSVRTLRALLLPQEQREASFYVGSSRFDPDAVGFESRPGGDSFRFETIGADGAPLPGNSNLGHSGRGYTQTRDEDGNWRDFTDDERNQLIEYMKTL